MNQRAPNGDAEAGTDLSIAPKRLSPTQATFVAALLLTQFFLLAYRAGTDSFVWDEVAHLSAGITLWEYGDTSLYCVNPPLVRRAACFIPWTMGFKENRHSYRANPKFRSEFGVGRDFVDVNHTRSFRLLTIARLSICWIVPLGGFVAYTWSASIFGRSGGMLTLWLWTFSPSLLAHGAYITPDAAATVFALVTVFLIWRWGVRKCHSSAILVGLSFGLAILTKLTLIILILPIASVAVLNVVTRKSKQKDQLGENSTSSRASRITSIVSQLVTIFSIAWFVLNCGYEFEGTFKPLGEYQFVSRTLSGLEAVANSPNLDEGNRFHGSVVESVPVPFPEMWIKGFDVQKKDFEFSRPAFLMGTWSDGGWWYYYVVAFLLKEPLAVLILLSIIGLFACKAVINGAAINKYFFVTAILTPVAILILVSSQTALNQHSRYLLPSIGFVYVLCGSVFTIVRQTWVFKVVILVLCFWYATSSMLTYPHSLAYFNEAAGGSKNGWNCLAGSNVDWGQDLLWLKKWQSSHPSRSKLVLEYSLPLVDPAVAGIEYAPMPTITELKSKSDADADFEKVLTTGWYAISVSSLNRPTREFGWIEAVPPEGVIGFSILLFEIDEKDKQTILSWIKSQNPTELNTSEH